MSGLFWNARGLGKVGKKKFLQETISEQQLCFVGIQESKKTFSLIVGLILLVAMILLFGIGLLRLVNLEACC